MTDGMDDAVSRVENAATKAQEQIYKLLLAEINNFEINDGRFIVGQDYTKRLAIITKKINAIIGSVYTPSIKDYLGHYSTIDEITLGLHKSYNELVIEKSLLTPARRIVYDQAEYFLTNGLADAYVQPAKFLLMQQVTTGITIKDAQGILKQWNEGNLVSGKLTSGRQVHRLQAYSTQISRDSIYGYQGTIQNIIAKEYDLSHFIYVGNLVRDSRPLCKHLIGLKRKIDINEMPPLIAQFPDGLYPNTTRKNWYINRAGYNCTHAAFPVKS